MDCALWISAFYIATAPAIDWTSRNSRTTSPGATHLQGALRVPCSLSVKRLEAFKEIQFGLGWFVFFRACHLVEWSKHLLSPRDNVLWSLQSIKSQIKLIYFSWYSSYGVHNSTKNYVQSNWHGEKDIAVKHSVLRGLWCGTAMHICTKSRWRRMSVGVGHDFFLAPQNHARVDPALQWLEELKSGSFSPSQRLCATEGELNEAGLPWLTPRQRNEGWRGTRESRFNGPRTCETRYLTESYLSAATRWWELFRSSTGPPLPGII